MANVLNKPIIIIGSGGSEHLVECEKLPETINKSKIYRVSREITLGEFNDIYLYSPWFKDVFGKEFLSHREFMTLDGMPPFAFNYILVDSLPDYESFVNGDVTVYDKISNKTIDVTMLDETLMYVFISEETSDAYYFEDVFYSMSVDLGTDEETPLPCMGAITSVSEITDVGLYLMYYEGDRHIAYNVTSSAGEPYLLDNAIMSELGFTGAPLFTEPIMDHILFDSTQSTDEGIYDLATGHFREYDSTILGPIPTVIAIDINDYSAYVNTGYSGMLKIDDAFGYDSKGVVDSLDEMTEEGYYILKRNNSASGEGTSNIKTSIHVPYSGEYSNVTVEYPEGTVNKAYRDPKQVTITPSEEVQEFNSTGTSYIDKVTVEAIPIELATVSSSETTRTITAPEGTFHNEIVIEYGTKSDRTNFTKFFKDSDATEIRLIDTSNATNMSSMFYGCKSLTAIPLLDTRNVTDMNNMFWCCYKLTTIPLLDTRNVTDMSYMFNACSILTTIPAIDTSNVTNMNCMFRGCSSLTTIPLLDTSNVTDMSSMFYMSSFQSNLTAIPLLDTHNVTNMSYMVSSCDKLTTIPLLDTRNVTNMSFMFSSCESLTAIPALDTSNVTNMRAMFYDCRSLTAIPLLDTSNVTDMSSMFVRCYKLTTIPLLDTRNVTDMSSMFNICKNLTTIPLLDTRNVTNMRYMFSDCSSLTTIPALDTSNVIKLDQMFANCSSLKSILMTGMKANFDISDSTQFEQADLVVILNNLATVTSTATLTMGATNLAKLTDEDKLIATNKGWTLA